MTNPNVLRLTLNDLDRDYLDGVTRDFPDGLSSGKEGAAVNWINGRLDAEAQALTPQLSELSESFKSGIDAVHITGLPEAPYSILPPTPDAYESVEDAIVHFFDLPHLALSGLAGAVYGTAHVRGGRIIADIFPKSKFETKKDSAFGSNQIFDFHADGVVQPDTTPDIFALHCLKNKEQVPTFFSTVSALDFNKDVYSTLTEPVYTIVYEIGNEVDVINETPIIQEENNGRLRLNYYGAAKVLIDNPELDSEKYRAALHAFSDALQANTHSVTLQPGDMLFVDNKHALHGRRAFDEQAILPAERRWLRRVFIAQDPALVRQVKQSKDRILTSKYKLTTVQA